MTTQRHLRRVLALYCMVIIITFGFTILNHVQLAKTYLTSHYQKDMARRIGYVTAMSEWFQHLSLLESTNLESLMSVIPFSVEITPLSELTNNGDGDGIVCKERGFSISTSFPGVAKMCSESLGAVFTLREQASNYININDTTRYVAVGVAFIVMTLCIVFVLINIANIVGAGVSKRSGQSASWTNRVCLFLPTFIAILALVIPIMFALLMLYTFEEIDVDNIKEVFTTNAMRSVILFGEYYTLLNIAYPSDLTVVELSKLLITLNAEYMSEPGYIVHFIDQTTNSSEPAITDPVVANYLFGENAPTHVYASIIPDTDFLVALKPLVNDQQFILITSNLQHKLRSFTAPPLSYSVRGAAIASGIAAFIALCFFPYNVIGRLTPLSTEVTNNTSRQNRRNRNTKYNTKSNKNSNTINTSTSSNSNDNSLDKSLLEQEKELQEEEEQQYNKRSADYVKVEQRETPWAWRESPYWPFYREIHCLVFVGLLIGLCLQLVIYLKDCYGDVNLAGDNMRELFAIGKNLASAGLELLSNYCKLLGMTGWDLSVLSRVPGMTSNIENAIKQFYEIVYLTIISISSQQDSIVTELRMLNDTDYPLLRNDDSLKNFIQQHSSNNDTVNLFMAEQNIWDMSMIFAWINSDVNSIQYGNQDVQKQLIAIASELDPQKHGEQVQYEIDKMLLSQSKYLQLAQTYRSRTASWNNLSILYASEKGREVVNNESEAVNYSSIENINSANYIRSYTHSLKYLLLPAIFAFISLLLAFVSDITSFVVFFARTPLFHLPPEFSMMLAHNKNKNKNNNYNSMNKQQEQQIQMTRYAPMEKQHLLPNHLQQVPHSSTNNRSNNTNNNNKSSNNADNLGFYSKSDDAYWVESNDYTAPSRYLTINHFRLRRAYKCAVCWSFVLLILMILGYVITYELTNTLQKSLPHRTSLAGENIESILQDIKKLATLPISTAAWVRAYIDVNMDDEALAAMAHGMWNKYEATSWGKDAAPNDVQTARNPEAAGLEMYTSQLTNVLTVWMSTQDYSVYIDFVNNVNYFSRLLDFQTYRQSMTPEDFMDLTEVILNYSIAIVKLTNDSDFKAIFKQLEPFVKKTTQEGVSENTNTHFIDKSNAVPTKQVLSKEIEKYFHYLPALRRRGAYDVDQAAVSSSLKKSAEANVKLLLESIQTEINQEIGKSKDIGKTVVIWVPIVFSWVSVLVIAIIYKYACEMHKSVYYS